MALEFNNKNISRKVPVMRNNKFFGQDDFDTELEYAREYLEQDANQTVILYQVDLQKTNVNDIYVEAKENGVRFKTPVEIPVIYEIESAEMKAYNNKLQKGMYAQTGKLVFTVLMSTLEENQCDISRGDYIGVQINTKHREYFVVTDDGRVGSMANEYTLYGTIPIARTITAAPVDKNEFNG